jgi:uncharacterized protein YkwD
MRRLALRSSVVLGILLALSLFFSSSASAYTTSSWENTVAYHVNHYDRLPRGIAATRTNYTLSYYAHLHSVAMMRKGYLFHSTNLTSLVSSWSALGENVGVGPSLSLINQAFMNSAPHRANILCRCYRQFGLGVVRDTHGYYWVTQIFLG